MMNKEIIEIIMIESKEDRDLGTELELQVEVMPTKMAEGKGTIKEALTIKREEIDRKTITIEIEGE